MEKQKKPLFDYTLLFMVKIIRSFSLGIFSLIFFQNLIVKGFSLVQISNIQCFIVIGHVIMSKLIIAQVKIGLLNTLIVASLIRGIGGLILAHGKTNISISIGSLFGMITIYGEWFCPFASLEKVILAQLAKSHARSPQEYINKVQQLIDSYNVVGYIFQGIGACFSGFFFHYGYHIYSLLFNQSGELLLNYYATSSFVCMLLYALMNRYKIQTLENNIAISCEVSSSTTTCNVFLTLLYLLEGASSVLISQIFITYFYRDRHHTIYSHIGIVILVINLFKGLGYSVFKLFFSKCNWIILFIAGEVLPNCLLLFFDQYYDKVVPSTILFSFALALSAVLQPQKQNLMKIIFPNSKRASLNCIIVIGYIVGIMMGFQIQKHYLTIRAYGTQVVVSGKIKLLFDAVLFVSYWLNRVKIEEEGEVNYVIRGEWEVLGNQWKKTNIIRQI